VYSNEFLWAEGSPGQETIADFQQSMGTVLYCSRMRMTGLASSRTIAQV
jgi:hypothetical protein